MLAAKDRDLRDLERYVSRREVEGKLVTTDNQDLHFNMAVMHTQTGMYQEAEDGFLQLLQLNPQAPDVHYNLGILYDKYLQDRQRAAKHYTRFVELAPQSKDADLVRVWLLETGMDF